ncbi:MAG: HAD-IA family hydrolase [Acidimicrobiia bacterium]|nr:HAD-IA family hydrolase [Acidimicrobiia bacterium]
MTGDRLSAGIEADVDVLLLDLGGVCVLSPVELHPKAEAAFGFAPGTLDWKGPLDPDADELWQRMVLGDGLTERDYWHRRSAEIGELAGRELSLREYMTTIYSPPSDDLIRWEAGVVAKAARAAGYGVSALTNDLRAFHGPDWHTKIAFFELLDHLADCSDTDILKPDPRSYQRAVDIVGVDPERMLFVDDQPLNIKGAEAFGMQVHWFDVANPTRSWQAVADRLRIPVDLDIGT